MSEGDNEERPIELISDQQYMVYQYRVLLDIMEEVKLGFADRKDLDAAIDNFVKFKIPSKYAESGKIHQRGYHEEKYRVKFLGEIFAIKQRYQSETERAVHLGRVENEIRWSADLDILEEIKKLLESEKIMNIFASNKGESLGGPV